MSGAAAEFGFWQALGRKTGVRDDVGPVDWARLERRTSPNDSFFGEESVAPLARADGAAPLFDETPLALMQKLRAVALAEPRTQELYEGGAAGTHLRFVQRSWLLGYPDIIDAMAYPRGEGSSLALYSRSLVGRSDLGVNRARIERWLNRLRG